MGKFLWWSVASAASAPVAAALAYESAGGWAVMWGGWSALLVVAAIGLLVAAAEMSS